MTVIQGNGHKSDFTEGKAESDEDENVEIAESIVLSETADDDDF